MITLCYINEGDKDKPLIVIFTQQDVEPWGELSFSYSGVSDEDVAVITNFLSLLARLFAAINTVLAQIANRSDEGAVYAQCRCGAPGCRGVMFK
jgi:histone-lysine N-methyltransferase SUV39H